MLWKYHTVVFVLFAIKQTQQMNILHNIVNILWSIIMQVSEMNPSTVNVYVDIKVQ